MLKRSIPSFAFGRACAIVDCASAAHAAPRYKRSAEHERIMLPLERQGFQVVAERTAEIISLQSELDGGFQEAEFVARIVTRAIEFLAVDRTVAEQMAQSVRQLDLAAGAGLHGLDGREDFGSQHVPADDCEV